MKKYILLLFLGVTVPLSAQEIKLEVPDVRQKETNWCWAAVSQCVLNYYGYSSIKQCEVAEYARGISTWVSLGETPCCEEDAPDCNKGTYNCNDIVEDNIVHDILIHFGKIGNTCEDVLTTSQISYYLKLYRPFLIFRSDGSGHGHIVVGFGMINDFSQGTPPNSNIKIGPLIKKKAKEREISQHQLATISKLNTV